MSPEEFPPPPAALISEHGTVDTNTFSKAHAEDQETLIPSLPGVYVWTYNIVRLLGGDQEQEAERRMDNLLKVVGRTQQHKVGPYSSVTVRDERQAINLGRRAVLHERFAKADDFGRWLAGIAVHVQRPLYVGKANNLHARTKRHLNGGTGLRSYVVDRKHPDGTPEFTASMLDLVVTWYAAPRSLWATAPIVDTTTGSEPEGQPTADDDADGDGDDTATGASAETEDETATGVQVSKELEDWLYAGESLLIRLSMPMLNETQS